MATFVDLDSFERDRETYPNPNDYQLQVQQIKTWNRASRSVRAFPQNPNIEPKEFVTTINIRYMTLPYSDAVAALPRIYVNFVSRTYKDINLIQTINGIHSDAKFICVPDRIQEDPNTGNPIWIHYKCSMEQTMRFKRDDPILVQFTTRSGDVLPNTDTLVPNPPDPNQQTLITFELTPYIRDGDYDNQMLSTSTL